MKTSIRPIVEN